MTEVADLALVNEIGERTKGLVDVRFGQDDVVPLARCERLADDLFGLAAE